MIPELETKIKILKNSEETCKVLSEWFAAECERLENPYLWDKDNFDIEGRSSLKAAVILRNMIKILAREELKERKITTYR